MNPYEQKLRAFVDDDVMFNAVRNVFMQACDLNQLDDVTMPDTELYFKATSWIRARALITAAFKDLEKFRTRSKSDTDTTNPNGV